MTIAHLAIRDRHLSLPLSGWILADRQARWVIRWNYRRLRLAGLSPLAVRTTIVSLLGVTHQADYRVPQHA